MTKAALIHSSLTPLVLFARSYACSTVNQPAAISPPLFMQPNLSRGVFPLCTLSPPFDRDAGLAGRSAWLPRPALRLFLLSTMAMVGFMFIRSGNDLAAFTSIDRETRFASPSPSTDIVLCSSSTSALQHARVRLLHIPKTGGSMLNCAGNDAQWRSIINHTSGIDHDNAILRSGHHSLLESDTERLRRHSHQNGSTIVAQTPLPLLSPSQSAALSADTQNYFIFFVRSPVTRFVSAFISRLRRGRPLSNCDHTPAEAETFRSFPTPEHIAAQLYPAPSSAVSADPAVAANVSAARTAWSSIAHLPRGLSWYLFSPAHVRAYVAAQRLLFVGRLEAKDEDYERLRAISLARLSFSPPPLSAQAACRHATPPEYRSMTRLSDQARRNVMRWYRADYELIRELRGLGMLPADYLQHEFDELDTLPVDQHTANTHTMRPLTFNCG